MLLCGDSRQGTPLFRIAKLFQHAGDETEFLPAALEVMETPPSPASRMIGATIVMFFLVAVLWACIGTVDIIATAQGKVVPTGRTKIIQPLEAGVVRAIHVQDGQRVKEGEVLVEIDSTTNGSERDRLGSEYMRASLEGARLKAGADIKGDPLARFVPPEGATAIQVELQKTMLKNQVDEIDAKLSALDRQIAQYSGSHEAVVATISKLNDSIPYLEKRAEARNFLAEKGYGSKLEYLSTQQDLVEHQRELKVQAGRLNEAKSAIGALKEQRRQAEDEYIRTTLKDFAEVEQKAESLRQQMIQAANRYRLQTLAAPVDGTVQQVTIHTEGGVVMSGQALMAIVPLDSHLEIEAMVSNRDIGFVRTGQQAAIKIDTFNFTKYGLLNGTVVSVARDAFLRERATNSVDERVQSQASGDSSEPQNQELVYSARVAPEETQMLVDGRLESLQPGMAVTVEIKTGSRRILEYLLSPLVKYQHQAFRER